MAFEKSPEAELNQLLFRKWRDARSDWDVQARLDIDFSLGNHFTSTESDDLAAMNQAEVPADRIGPAIDKLQAVLTARPPVFTAVPREDSDVKIANIWRLILGYIWDISEGDAQAKEAIGHFSRTGLGWFYVYLDRESDFGRGDPKFTAKSPFSVYVPPTSRDRWFRDAEGILLSTILSGEQLVNLYPHLGDQVDEETGEIIEGPIHEIDTVLEEDWPEAQNKETMNIWTPAEAKSLEWNQSKYQILERFYPVKVPFFRVEMEDQEYILDEEAFNQLLQERAGLFESGQADYEEVLQTRIAISATVGQITLGDEVLNCDTYPLIPIPNIWTESPYPRSDVSRARPMQKLLNRLWSLALSHAQASAGLKLLVPSGSVDNMDDLEIAWANPNAVIEYRPEMAGGGEPHYPAPQQLASEFYRLIQQCEHYIDLTFGMPEMMQGFPDKAPETVRGTERMIALGAERPKSKLRDIEFSINLLGRVLYQMAKSHYTYKKLFTLAQPNNDLTDFMVNVYDDVGSAVNDIAKNKLNIGQHDIRIQQGSTLPTSKWAEFGVYLEMFDRGIVDDIEVLKKHPEIYDKEKIIQRKSILVQAQNIIKMLEEELEKTRGDLQTAQRQEVSALKGKEMSKFKSALHEILADVEADKKVAGAKLGASVKVTEEQLKSLVSNETVRQGSSSKKEGR